MRARSSVHAATRGAQNQWITTLPAASPGDGTSYSQSSLGVPGTPSSPSASPTAGSLAAGGGAGLPGLPAPGDGDDGWACVTAAAPRTAANTSRYMAGR